ncbi:MAG: molybdopterin-dependent oxidoreductase [Hyphomicrobiaceae bacterium]
MTSSRPLPPGQREWPTFPRFGLPPFAKIWPEVPEKPAIAIDGDVETPLSVTLDDLAGLERVDQVSDFHCVCTWSRRNVRWGGVRFRDFYQAIVVPRAGADDGVAHVRVIGADGYRADLHLEDAFDPEVLLADTLDGEPLPLAHGAPLRLVSPAQYGYKSVRHVRKILFTVEAKTLAGVTGLLAHPRGRVAHEERSRGLPGSVLRRIYRAGLPAALWYFRRHDREG